MKKKLYFGRVKSRKISKIKENSFKKYLKTRNINRLNSKKKLILEIGIGMGENIIYLSKKNTKKIIIGVDPFKNGIVNVSDYCINNNIKNIYLYPYVFQKFINKFKKLRFDIIYVLFPDPWPKKKHEKRRIVNEEFLKKIFVILKKKGKVFFSTDNLDYYTNVKTLLKKFPNFKSKKVNKIVTIKTKFYLKAEKKGNKINSLLLSKY
jgi:tRNA (guanine-N7-)-methyltransferase|tara:strand:- start:336 stop:956 length:621 start_codon:yes stop_codon:yes gene_type:complete